MLIAKTAKTRDRLTKQVVEGGVNGAKLTVNGDPVTAYTGPDNSLILYGAPCEDPITTTLYKYMKLSGMEMHVIPDAETGEKVIRAVSNYVTFRHSLLTKCNVTIQ